MAWRASIQAASGTQILLVFTRTMTHVHDLGTLLQRQVLKTLSSSWIAGAAVINNSVFKSLVVFRVNKDLCVFE
jgi:hypothetical protein